MTATMQPIIFVALGGALGSAARYAVSQFISDHTASTFPFSTMAVNIAGCLLIGLVYGLSARHGFLSDNMKLLLTTGFCGGFTTFSTFSLETIRLGAEGAYGIAALNIVLQNGLGLFAAALGFALAHRLIA